MTFLLDTHLLLWAAGDPSRLTPESRDLLANPTTELLFSTASIWEVVIKNALGRRDFRVEPRQLRDGLIQNGYSELTIQSEHASRSACCHRFTLTPSTASSSPKRTLKTSPC